MEDRRWQTSLPDDILSFISDLLPLSDFINFRGVCCNWRRAPSCRSNITELSKKDPWCILYDFDAQDKDMCLFYQRNSRRSCRVKLPGLRGAKCFVSKRGWLFIRRNNDYLLFNPLTLEEIFLPEYPVKSSGSSACQVGTFSASPSSPLRCIVVLLSLRSSSTVRIDSCRLTANKWVMTTVKFDTHGLACNSVLLPNPKIVYFKAAYDVSRQSNCINCINVCYDRHFLVFNCLEKKFEIYNIPLLDAVKIDKYLKNFNWYSKLKEAHSDDWIHKFGKEFTFSFCLFNDYKRDECKDFSSDSGTVPNILVIKAAWLYKV
ncbi:hypothetical protein KSP40_PGU014852 [Platanthera guangdongensis]|uniref:F-box domain-containing protein n=1 Tax=Platanthera guangdongensis TaxID=2320717 RepID=A0ABR2M960_9ASPA